MNKNFEEIRRGVDLFIEESQLDLKSLTEKAATIVSDKGGFIGVGILVKIENDLILHSFSQNKITKFINEIVGGDYSWIEISLAKDSLFKKALTSGEIQYSSDLSFFPSTQKLQKITKKVHAITKAKQYMLTPISYNGENVGVALFSTKEKSFTKEQDEIAQYFCQKLSSKLHIGLEHRKILQRSIKEEQARSNNLKQSQLDAISTIHNTLATKSSLGEVSKHITEELISHLGVKHSVLYLWNEERQGLENKSIHVSSKILGILQKHKVASAEKVSIFIPKTKKENIFVKSLTSESILTSSNLHDGAIGVMQKSQSQKAQKILGIKYIIAVPLSFHEIKLGVLGLSWKKEGVTEEELELLKTYGEHLSLAIYNVQRIEEQEKSELTESYHKRIIDTTRGLFAGEFDFEKASDTAITEFNEDMGFYGTNIYRKEGRKLRAYLYSRNDGTKFISKIINDSQYRNLLIPLEDSESIIARAGVEMNIFETQSFENFAHKIVTKPIMNLMKTALPKDLWYASFPIMHNNKLEGVLAVGKRGAKLTPAEKEATMFFCEQLGLAMANMKAHKKIVERFEKQQQLRARNIDPDKKPTIKFTLRISKEIERYLTWKIHNTDKSKADFLRNLLTEDVIKNDQQYQDFLNQ